MVALHMETSSPTSTDDSHFRDREQPDSADMVRALALDRSLSASQPDLLAALTAGGEDAAVDDASGGHVAGILRRVREQSDVAAKGGGGEAEPSTPEANVEGGGRSSSPSMRLLSRLMQLLASIPQVAAPGGPGFCKVGCQRKCGLGRTANDNPFSTCCRRCVVSSGAEHDDECNARALEKEPVSRARRLVCHCRLCSLALPRSSLVAAI